jgi:GntR family transcriptional repressor for pyruvate dehydrogenase complex
MDNLSTKRPSEDVSWGLDALAKEHTADRIVEALGAKILRGQIAEGEILPSERVLAEGFGVARGTVRQAVHKLADWGLVHVKQGGATRVAKLDDADSLQVTELRYKLGPIDAREKREWTERRLMQGLAIMTLVEIRGDRDEIAKMAELADRFAGTEDPAEIWQVETAIWTGLARVAGNRLFERELRWWSRITSPRREDAVPSVFTPSIRVTFYRELFRRLAARDGAARYYLEMSQLLLQQQP